MSLPPPPTLTHCYRHPDREAGRRCTRCGNPACSDCLIQAQVGSHCLACAKAALPDVKTRIKYANAKQLTLVTNAIIAINVAVFIWVAAGDSASLSGSGPTERQFEIGLNRIQLREGLRYARDSDAASPHEWYRLLTSGFLHFGIIHILLNMYLLYLLGQLLERSLGRLRFSMLYAASLLGGSAGVLLLTDSGITGGASGAVFGLMGAAAISMHREGINIMNTGIGRTLAINLVITFVLGSSLGISIGGHIGGLVAGTICGVVMLAPKWKPFPKWATYATPVAVSFAAVVISVIRVG